jgi:8-oxo-dGTP diphosphatase
LKPGIRVVAALIPDPADDRRFLVQQRLPGKSRANLWEFPGGKVEPGESDEAALIRECREELGVELQIGRRLWGTTHAYSDLTVTLELFSARLGQGTPQPLGAQAIRYCTFAQMRALPFCEADLPLLEALQTGKLVPS